MRLLENGYTVKDLGLENINGLASLHKSAFTRGWEAHDFAQFVQDRQMKLLGAFKNGGREPSAFLLVRQVEDEAEVISIAVGRTHRRRGIGVGLLDAAIDELSESGVKELHLEVDGQNNAAVELYKNMGFEVVGERRAYYPGGHGKTAANALMMCLHLDDY